MRFLGKTATMLAAGIGIACASVPVSATTASIDKLTVREIPVRYGDLNLNTDQGAERLYTRLAVAAHMACGYNDDASWPTTRRAFRDCEQTTLSNAVGQVNREKLTAVYDTRNASHPLGSAARASALPRDPSPATLG